MRLIRTAVLLGAAGLFLPSPPEDPKAADPSARTPSTVELLSSAGAAASDAWSFCSRQPDICAVAGYLAERLEAKTLYSASLLWGLAWDGSKSAIAADDGLVPALTVTSDAPDEPDDGMTAAPVSAAAQVKGRSTLRLDDLIPEWRGPSRGHKKDG